MRVSLCLSIVIVSVFNCRAQQNRSTHILDERLKTSFLVTYPREFACDLPSSFEDLKQCFSNLDSLESTIIQMTEHMDDFLANEPDPYLDEPPKVYWVSEIQWAKRRVVEGDTIPSSMWCWFSRWRNALYHSQALELRQSQSKRLCLHPSRWTFHPLTEDVCMLVGMHGGV